jgi:hypothetical protein
MLTFRHKTAKKAIYGGFGHCNPPNWRFIPKKLLMD